MKGITTALLSMTAALFCGHANAIPTAPAKLLESRSKAEIVTAILQIFQQIAKGGKLAFDQNTNAWDIAANPHMCSIYMETTNGANCYATVKCSDGVTNEFNVGKAGWNVCYIGGRQFFTDPRIGDFSITFTGRDGDGEGEGLTTPILQLADIADWTAIPVKDLANDHDKYWRCNNRGDNNCGDGPYICKYPIVNNRWQDEGRTRRWECGVPMRGQNFLGLDSNVPVPKGYAPGLCRVHVTHYQKPDPSKDPYSLEAWIYDANQNIIGSSGKQVGNVLVLTTPLPNTFTITARNVDADALKLGYDGLEWDSTAANCKVGGYDSGNRDMDCTFECK